MIMMINLIMIRLSILINIIGQIVDGDGEEIKINPFNYIDIHSN